VAVDSALGTVTAPAGGRACDANFSARWIWFFALTGLTVLLCVGLSYRKQKEASPTDRFYIPIVEVLAATAAFSVWALALANTPLQDFCMYNPSTWSPVLLLGGTIVVTSFLFVLRKTVNWEKVLVSS
jgi:hypothetical protein